MENEHIRLIEKVYEEEYYLDVFDSMIEDMGLTLEEAKELSGDEVSSFWNQFWIELPDSQSIHRAPFYEICDMAEGIFDDGDEYYDDDEDEEF